MSKSEGLLSKLEAAAARLGVTVSYESIVTTGAFGSGGLCKVRGAYRIIVDRRAVETDRIAVIASSLARLDTTGLELEPEVASAIDLYALSRAS